VSTNFILYALNVQFYKVQFYKVQFYKVLKICFIIYINYLQKKNHITHELLVNKKF